MDSQPQTRKKPFRPQVQPGERAALFSHVEFIEARDLGLGLENYDILMRPPLEVEDEKSVDLTQEDWQLLPAAKYLKHRANGWREPTSRKELPPKWLTAIGKRRPFVKRQPPPPTEPAEPQERQEPQQPEQQEAEKGT